MAEIELGDIAVQVLFLAVVIDAFHAALCGSKATSFPKARLSKILLITGVAPVVDSRSEAKLYPCRNLARLSDFLLQKV